MRNPRSLIAVYILTIGDVDLVKSFIGESVEYEENVQRAFVTDRFGSLGEKQNSYVQMFGGGEENVELWVATILLLFRTNVR